MDHSASFNEILVPVLGFLISMIAIWIGKTLRELTDSIAKLNINVAVLIEKIHHHETKFEHYEERFSRLELRVHNQ